MTILGLGAIMNSTPQKIVANLMMTSSYNPSRLSAPLNVFAWVLRGWRFVYERPFQFPGINGVFSGPLRLAIQQLRGFGSILMGFRPAVRVRNWSEPRNRLESSLNLNLNLAVQWV